MSRDEFLKGEAREIHILGHREPLVNRLPFELEKNKYLTSLGYYVSKMNEIDEDMPVILEHLDSDDEYIRYMKYLQKVLA